MSETEQLQLLLDKLKNNTAKNSADIGVLFAMIEELEKKMASPTPTPTSLLTQDSFIPEAICRIPDIGREIFFTPGGADGEIVDGALHLFMLHNIGWPTVEEFLVDNWVPYDPTVTDLKSYAPQATHLTSHGYLWGGAKNHFGVTDQNYYGQGVLVRPDAIYQSGRHKYITHGARNTFFARKDRQTGEVTYHEIEGNTQTFGGGFMTGHPEVVFGNGWYSSGQYGASGPCYRTQNKVLIQYPAFNAPKEQRERRPPDYNAPGGAWFVPPDGDIGYVFSSECYGGAAWCEHGCVIFVVQGIGDIFYDMTVKVNHPHTKAFSHNYKFRMYVYDPTFENKRGVFYDWPYPDIKGYFFVEEDDGLKMIGMFPWMWKVWPHDYKRFPALIKFKVVI